MKNKDIENLEFIKNKFNEAEPDVPSSLNESVIEYKILSNEEHKTVKFKPKNNWFKATVSIAACFILIFGVVFAVYQRNDEPPVTSSGVEGPVLTFKNYNEINNYIKDLDQNEMLVPEYYAYAAVDEVKDDSGITTTTMEGGAAGNDHSETYEQVDGVHEADIVKTDGEYIYYAYNDFEDEANKCNVYIFKADNGETELASIINCKTNYEFAYVNDMFLYEDRLIVNLWDSNYEDKPWQNYNWEDTSVTVTEIYDISDRANPKLISDFEQSGSYISSRMINNIVYIISTFYIYTDNKDYYVPKCGVGGKASPLPANDICYFANSSSAQYDVISAIDVKTGTRATNTKALLGGSAEVYCNENNLYITQYRTVYDYSLAHAPETIEEKTDIIKVELNGSEIKFAASGSVDGYINNQFSMAEKDGFFRIAVTKGHFWTEDVTNQLYVLDENLDIVGQTEDFAKDESIRAVRFIGDMAYVITFEQTDPLFIIDLSTPQSPEIKGNVEIEGFSSLLVPVNENQLLGIGYYTESQYEAVTLEGLKLALFDISNAKKPKVLSSEVLVDTFSGAQDNHKELVVNREKGYYAIPFYCFGDMSDFGVLTFEIQNNAIEITNRYVNETDREYEYTSRCLYIGDYIYSIDIDDYAEENEKIIIYSYKY